MLLTVSYKFAELQTMRNPLFSGTRYKKVPQEWKYCIFVVTEGTVYRSPAPSN